MVTGVVLAGAVSWPLVERPARAAEDHPAETAAEGGAAPSAEERPAWALAAGPALAVPAPDGADGPAATTVGEPGSAPLGATLRLPEETIAPEPEADGPQAPAPTAAPEPVDDAPVVEEPDDDYAHLWGSTILRTVEDAAVRTEEDEEHGEPDVPGAPVPVLPPVPAVPPTPDEPAAPPPSADGLIAGVPREWTGATPAAAHRAATVVDPEGEQDAPSAGQASGLDHDGHTVLSSAIADLRAAAQDAEPEAAPVPPPPVPSFSAPPGPGQQQILARTCAQGHANPPSRDVCAVCDGPLDGDAELAVRPPLGRLVVSTGQTVELDRPVVVGRRPRSPRTQATELPRLVTVPSPQQDISRSHVEITLEGWHVLVSDMATTNGTTLLRAGQPPRRLHPSEPVLVVDGDVADLGDGVTLVFEGIR
ncbi:FHA domain-containing protein [Cellulosimicrobium protaetiae]|uniref:FHA domain-containing protein n=1 Tax=Cellulosimicrobium protaetiae TaxID=2587808 RepID=A0A6M5UJA3_9MICO|nr:FHA domain-containing protein [Cellulosimicrobium protaetiae]